MKIELLIETDDFQDASNIEAPTVPRVGDALVLVNEEGAEVVYEVVGVTWKVGPDLVAFPQITVDYPAMGSDL